MADLESVIDKINDIEVGQDKPNTEALMRKIGSDINALIDKFNARKTFVSSTTWVVPPGTTQLFYEGCGGGAGGGGGAYQGGGGSGGVGATPINGMIQVTPGQTLTITIGAGGTGGAGGVVSGSLPPRQGSNGSNGGATRITGTNVDVYLPGGKGGLGGQTGVSEAAQLGGSEVYEFAVSFAGVTPGYSGRGSGYNGSASGGIRNKFTSTPSAGGTDGGGVGGSYAGGGGGSAFGAGGDGADGVAAGNPGATGHNSANYGGGGGGASGGSSSNNGGTGGNGAGGFLALYFTEDVS